jgi:hypothetical protein
VKIGSGPVADKVPAGMVVHNDKWKRKATREYHKKHGTLAVGQGRGRGRGRGVVENEPVPGLVDDAESDDGSHEEGAEIESGDHEERPARRERSKYARRKIESNAWRFESQELDPYLGTTPPNQTLMAVINEEDLEPPEPDYAHLPARPFEARKQGQSVNQISGIGRGKKQQSIKETELAPLKAQIDKANAARAFKERFSVGHRGNVLRVDEDGVARRQIKERLEEEEEEDIDDIDRFLAELDIKKGTTSMNN